MRRVAGAVSGNLNRTPCAPLGAVGAGASGGVGAGVAEGCAAGAAAVSDMGETKRMEAVDRRARPIDRPRTRDGLEDGDMLRDGHHHAHTICAAALRRRWDIA